MLSSHQIMGRLQDIDNDMAELQVDLGKYAEAWTRIQRLKAKAWADTYMSTKGEVTTRKAAATQASEMMGIEEEAKYVGLSKVVGVLQARAMIGESLLKAYGRGG